MDKKEKKTGFKSRYQENSVARLTTCKELDHGIQTRSHTIDSNHYMLDLKIIRHIIKDTKKTSSKNKKCSSNRKFNNKTNKAVIKRRIRRKTRNRTSKSRLNNR